MSTKHIIVKTSQDDQFAITLPGEQQALVVSLDQGDENKLLKSNIFPVLDAAGLVVKNTAYDLINFALGLYTIDQTVSRALNGFQGWSRHLVVYLPVHNLEAWLQVKEKLEEYIGFLSGDKWYFRFRQYERAKEVPEIGALQKPEGFTEACLFSGGLDSFIGAIDLLNSPGKKPYFVSHYKGGGTESKTQEDIILALAAKYGGQSFKSSRFYVQPNQKNPIAQKENSSRARSLLFICLGLTVANSLGDQIPLILPENGLISLNIPLTRTRLSSHSTRTTHPYFINGLNQILDVIGIPNKIRNPYRFATKGEMMEGCKDVDFLMDNVSDTISCSHPEQSRFSKQSPGLNCGYCVPCIIRQAAEHYIGEITTEYAWEGINKNQPAQSAKKGADYRAFKMALEKLDRINAQHSLALLVIRSGPIPYLEEGDFSNYVSVYKRGMNEVREFLNSQ